MNNESHQKRHDAPLDTSPLKTALDELVDVIHGMIKIPQANNISGKNLLVVR